MDAAPDDAPHVVAVRRRWWRASLETAGVGAAVFLAALLGLRVGLPGTSASPVWVAAGVSLAGVLLFGRRVLVGVAVGALLAELTANPLGLSVLFAAAKVVEPLIAGTALLRLSRGRPDLLHIRDVGLLLGFGAGAGAAVSASIGAASLAVTFDLPSSDVLVNWFTWWLGDASGIILITPLLVYALGRPYVRAAPGQMVVAGLLLAATVAVGQLAFSGSTDPVWSLPMQFLIVLLIAWIAFEFGPRLSMLAVNLVMLTAVIGAVRSLGPFMGPSLNTVLLSLQASMCALGVAVLIIAVLVDQRREAIVALVAERGALEQKVRERTAELEEQATHDPLTGLLNRRAFDDVLRRAVARARRGQTAVVLYGDLDGFKACNDRLGHAGGDGVLVAVAERLVGEVRTADVVARLGGDEFAVLLDGAPTPTARDIGERMCRRIVELGDEVGVPMAMSVGMVKVDGGREADDLLAAVDAAMYAAKARPDACMVVEADGGEGGIRTPEGRNRP